jgi:ribosomal protein S18 acetylase RimI-like enzyme
MITTIEELSLNAWPSLQTVLYDGWIIRCAKGYTKRANSVYPLYFSTIDTDEKIRFCERIYQDRKMATVFKMTSAINPKDLDVKLAASGYHIDSPTSVQIMDLKSPHAQVVQRVSLREDLSEEWLDGFCHMSAVVGKNRETLRQILINIIPHHCFVSLKAEDKMVACGLGVLQSEYIGLFDIVTDHAFRNHGYGQQVVNSILAWGGRNGARKAYLQVMLNNAPALHLYSKIGFVEKYQYWYRIKNTDR